MTSKLEALMMEEGRDRSVTAYRRSLEKGQISYLDRGRHLISSDTREFADWLSRWRLRCQKNYESLRKAERDVYDAVTRCTKLDTEEPFSLDTPVLALVVVDYVYNRLGNINDQAVKLRYLQAELGTRIQEEMIYRMFNERHRDIWDQGERYVKKASAYLRKQAVRKAFRSRGFDTRLWSMPFRDQIGAWFLEAFRLATAHIVFRSFKSKGVGYISYVFLEEKVWDYISKSTEDDIHYRPRLTPIFDLPKDWTGFWNGGYHDPSLQRSFVLTDDDLVLDFYRDREFGDALRAASILQKTSWDISPLAKGTLDHYSENNIARAGLVESEPRELPERVKGEDGKWTKESRLDRRDVYAYNRRNRSKRSSYKRSKIISDRMTNPFYFIYRADSRGRLYPQGDFLNPQGGDWSRGQLVFHEYQPVDDTALRWLKIAGANMAGQDKLCFDERVAWVDGNIDLIAAVADDPLGCKEWEDFDEPFQFLAWAEDFVHALGTGMSRCPVSLDGSNNGLQVFSLILRHRRMAEATNVVKVETPNDIYQFVADQTVDLLDQDSYDLGLNGEYAKKWLSFFDKHFGGKFPRALAKRPVMTKAYAVTRYTVNKYISQWLTEDYPQSFGKKQWKMCEYLGGRLWRAMDSVLEGASEGMLWLQDAAKKIVDTTNEIPNWTTPSGFPVFQPYYRWETEEVKLIFGQRTKLRRVRKGAVKENPRKQKASNAVAPNFVHGIDAAIAHRLALRLDERGVPAMRFVHDSFGVHAAHAQTMSETIREVVYEVTRDDLLARLKDEWEGRYKVDLPDLPEYGDLDPKEVLDAEYAYS